ncbi:MAG: ribosomal protein S18-alanine N-acetyltransferase [Deltaproteobacteria bacterium]|jgi:ribosomal-protein-alanine N-acetyltransferase|nr:ribosomal protein S18-alanine N-acetyltransferase [Deltaproteobacteria bacterium]
MNGISIRKLTPEDLGAILMIEKASFDYPWSEKDFLGEFEMKISGNLGIFLDKKHLLGYTFYWLIEYECHILNLAVDHKWRRKEVATTLLKALFHKAQQKKAHIFFLEVRETNVPAINLYRRMGFTVVGRRESYYADGLDALVMNLDLLARPI